MFIMILQLAIEREKERCPRCKRQNIRIWNRHCVNCKYFDVIACFFIWLVDTSACSLVGACDIYLWWGFTPSGAIYRWFTFLSLPWLSPFLPASILQLCFEAVGIIAFPLVLFHECDWLLFVSNLSVSQPQTSSGVSSRCWAGRVALVAFSSTWLVAFAPLGLLSLLALTKTSYLLSCFASRLRRSWCSLGPDLCLQLRPFSPLFPSYPDVSIWLVASRINFRCYCIRISC